MGKDTGKWMKQSVAAVMPKGSILVFDGQCYHAGGANKTSDQQRFGVLTNFCAGYLRPQENSYLSIPQDQVALFPKGLRRLLGYSPSSAGLGVLFRHEAPGHLKQLANTGNLDIKAIAK